MNAKPLLLKRLALIAVCALTVTIAVAVPRTGVFAVDNPQDKTAVATGSGSRSRNPETKYEHLLDGTSMNYYYQNGSGIHIEFYNGMLKYKWIVGPRKGHGNEDLEYRSRKIGDKMYVINWLEESHPDFVTIIFNFDNNVMYSSGLLRFGSEKQRIVFDGGIIEDLNLKRKE